MNVIVNKLLLAGDKFMPKLHLKEKGFAYSVFYPFTKKKERIEKFMKSGNTDSIYRNQLDKACFQHDMAYGKPKGLGKRTQSDKEKILRDKAFKITSAPKHDGYQRGLTSMVYKFNDKNLVEVVLTLKQITNLQMNFIDRLFEKLREEKFIHLVETMFGALVYLTCNH